MNPQDVEQNTPEWLQARCGDATASRLNAVLAKPKKGSKESVTRKAYMVQLVCERLTGKPQQEEWESWDMKRGKALEPIARTEYELETGLDVRTVGYIKHPGIGRAGCSPDAYVGEDGLAQFKAPRPHVHYDYITNGIVPPEYRPQMYFEMACTNRKWNDFVSYCEEFDDHLRLFICRLERDEAEILQIESEVKQFLAEVEEALAKLPKKKHESALEASLRASLKQTELQPEETL